jgi:rare lipoprotein A
LDILKGRIWLGLIIPIIFSLFNTLKAQKNYTEKGMASYYGKDFHGKKTACGEKFDMYEFTGAHKKLPFNTLVKVTNLSNGKSVIVRINDRGPFTKKRIIDLSKAAASRIDMLRSGVASVKIEVVGTDDLHPKKKQKEVCKADTTDELYNTIHELKTENVYNTEGEIKAIRGYTIQIAALNDPNHIIEMLQKLKRENITKVFIDVKIKDKKKIYRILIGDFSELEGAEEELENLVRIGYQGFIKKYQK